MSHRTGHIGLRKSSDSSRPSLRFAVWACLLASAPLLGIAQTGSKAHDATGTSLEARSSARKASDSELSPALFKSPPAIYRPIATLGDHGTSKDLLERTQRVLLDRDYGSILFSPNGDRSRARKVQFDPNSIPTMHVGLMKEYPEGASQWLPKEQPGEAGIGSYMRHKVRHGDDVYFFGNSSDSPIRSTTLLRGGAGHLELSDPASGSIHRITDVHRVVRRGETYSQFELDLPALSGLIVVSKPD